MKQNAKITDTYSRMEHVKQNEPISQKSKNTPHHSSADLSEKSTASRYDNAAVVSNVKSPHLSI